MFVGVHVVVEGEDGWFVRYINIFCIFERKVCVQRKGCEG